MVVPVEVAEESHNPTSDQHPIFYWLDEVDAEDRQYLVIRHDKFDTMYCCCLKLESIGYPCRHMFAVMKYEKMKQIPAGCIYKRWTKHAKDNVIEGETTTTTTTTENDESQEMSRFLSLNGFSSKVNRFASRNQEMYDKMKDHYAKILIEFQKGEEATQKKGNHNKNTPIGIGDPEVVVNVKGKMKKSKCTCGICHKPGHNKHTCIEAPNISPSPGSNFGSSDDYSDDSLSASNDIESYNTSSQHACNTMSMSTSDDSQHTRTNLSAISEYMPKIYVEGQVQQVQFKRMIIYLSPLY